MHLRGAPTSPLRGAAVDPGATAWLLAATALGMVMIAGLCLLNSGMVRRKHALGMLVQGWTCLAVVSLVWVVVGFSLVFGPGNALIGGLQFAGLGAVDPAAVPGFTVDGALVIPPLLLAAFHMMLAVLAPALITGATADRWRFGPFVAFVAGWTVLVYCPIARWVFSPAGWAAQWGARDFAGGVVVHAAAGSAALAMALVLGRRRGWLREPMPPHSMPLVLLGAALLWFGWLGVNGGAALRADATAVQALVNTHVAAAAGFVAWTAVERIRFGRPTALGAVSGAVSGLVAATACAGLVSTTSALGIGAVAGTLCAGAVTLKVWFRIDDALDVVAVHLVAGVLGALAVGLFATATVDPRRAEGLFAGGGYDLLGRQAATVAVVVGYAFAATYVLGRTLDGLVGIRVDAAQEAAGLDLALHGENAYAPEGVVARAAG